MKAWKYCQTTEIHFGFGSLQEVGELVGRYGQRCLLVTTPPVESLAPVFARVMSSLAEAGVQTAHYAGVVPNPTTGSVSAGAALAIEFGADVILGVGGGSSMDTAKAIAVEAAHPGTAWDYLFFRPTQPGEKTLPVVAVSTTSGTGSQVTQVAVITNPETKAKSAIYHPRIFPRACIIDPDLMTTVPRHVTASTGFDVFCHAFESTLHPASSAYTELLADQAMRLVAGYLPQVVADGSNRAAREALAWADTLAGLCIANAGVTLPHGIGMTIGGHCPQVMHGEALAAVYPEFTRYTQACAVSAFARMGRILNPSLEREPDPAAAQAACEAVDRLLKQSDMWLDLAALGVAEPDLASIADHSQDLPDYKNNPRVATREEIYTILAASYRRS